MAAQLHASDQSVRDLIADMKLIAIPELIKASG